MHRPQRAVLLADGAEPVELGVPYPVDDLYDQIAHFTDLLRAGRTESPSCRSRQRCAARSSSTPCAPGLPRRAAARPSTNGARGLQGPETARQQVP